MKNIFSNLDYARYYKNKIGLITLKKFEFPGEIQDQESSGFYEFSVNEDRQIREAVPEIEKDGWQQRDHDRDPPCPQQAAETRGSVEYGCGAP